MGMPWPPRAAVPGTPSAPGAALARPARRERAGAGGLETMRWQLVSAGEAVKVLAL